MNTNATKLPKLRVGDTVKVLTGPDRGKEGKITQVLTREQRAVVEGVNLRKKNVKAKRDRQKGEIVSYNAPVQLSNLILLCPSCHKPTRVGTLVAEDGKRTRRCQHCKNLLTS